MQVPSSPPWTRKSAPGRRPGYGDAGLRVSDAERAQVADRLAKHYSDGRLDQAEFNQRLDQAMRAKTKSDLTGLFADLPGADAADVPDAPDIAARQRDKRLPRHRTLFLVLVVVITAALGQALARSYGLWLLIGLLAFFWLRYRTGRADR